MKIFYVHASRVKGESKDKIRVTVIVIVSMIWLSPFPLGCRIAIEEVS